ncbi:MAG: CaiB/BaiF CoA transferase family protein [Gammaproteobacteria bacterium]
MTGVLSGLKVIDCSFGSAGPMAAGHLADHGAEVIRIERPGGDPFKPFLPAQALYNRGKSGIAVDLGRPEGRQVAQRLIAGADVFIESWRPGGAARFGLDYAALHAAHPRLVYCSISGYGQEGRDRDRPGYESLVNARVGVMAEQYGHRAGPIFEGVPFTSWGAAMLAVIGIMTALVNREEDGAGRHVDTSLMDGALAFMSMYWEYGDLPEVRSTKNRRQVVASLPCADGEYLGMHTGAIGAHARFIEVLGLTDRVPPAAGAREKLELLTPEQQAVVDTEVPRIVASRAREELLGALLDADVCAIPVLRPTQVFDERQVRHNGYTVEVDDPDLGRVRQVGVVTRHRDAPGAVRAPAPRCGEHTDAVLRAAGYADADIAALRRAGAVA